MLNDYKVRRHSVSDCFYINVIAGFGDAFHYNDVKCITKEINGISVRIAEIAILYEM